jgi:hypothetical protein
MHFLLVKLVVLCAMRSLSTYCRFQMHLHGASVFPSYLDNVLIQKQGNVSEHCWLVVFHVPVHNKATL